MFFVTTDCFVTHEPVLDEKNECYIIKCGTKVGYDKGENKDINDFFTAKVKDKNFFNMIKTLKKGSHIILAGEFSYGIIEKEAEGKKEVITWYGLNVKSMSYMRIDKIYSNNEKNEKNDKVNNSRNKINENKDNNNEENLQPDESEEDDDLPF